MARARQTIHIKGRTVVRSSKNATKSKSKGKKRGNPNRCPACGRFM